MLEEKFFCDPEFNEESYRENLMEPSQEVELTNAEEIKTVLINSRNRSAPGIDGINHKTLNEMNKMHPGIQVALYNACIVWCIFPLIWQRGR